MQTQIKTWEEMNVALGKLTELCGCEAVSRFESLTMFRELRRHATDIPAGRDGEAVKRTIIETMDWAIELVAAEVGE